MKYFQNKYRILSLEFLNFENCAFLVLELSQKSKKGDFLNSMVKRAYKDFEELPYLDSPSIY